MPTDPLPNWPVQFPIPVTCQQMPRKNLYPLGEMMTCCESWYAITVWQRRCACVNKYDEDADKLDLSLGGQWTSARHTASLYVIVLTHKIKGEGRGPKCHSQSKGERWLVAFSEWSHVLIRDSAYAWSLPMNISKNAQVAGEARCVGKEQERCTQVSHISSAEYSVVIQRN